MVYCSGEQKENINAPYDRSVVKGIYQWFSSQRASIAESVSCRGVIVDSMGIQNSSDLFRLQCVKRDTSIGRHDVSNHR